MYKNNESTTNSGNKLGSKGQIKRFVNGKGSCNSSSTGGATPSSQNRQGNVGKGYRGGN